MYPFVQENDRGVTEFVRKDSEVAKAHQRVGNMSSFIPGGYKVPPEYQGAGTSGGGGQGAGTSGGGGQGAGTSSGEGEPSEQPLTGPDDSQADPLQVPDAADVRDDEYMPDAADVPEAGTDEGERSGEEEGVEGEGEEELDLDEKEGDEEEDDAQGDSDDDVYIIGEIAANKDDRTASLPKLTQADEAIELDAVQNPWPELPASLSIDMRNRPRSENLRLLSELPVLPSMGAADHADPYAYEIPTAADLPNEEMSPPAETSKQQKKGNFRIKKNQNGDWKTTRARSKRK